MDTRAKISVGIICGLGLASVMATTVGETMKTTVEKDKTNCLGYILLPDFITGSVGLCTLLLAHFVLRVETGHPYLSCGPPRPPVTIWIAIFSWFSGALAGIMLVVAVAKSLDCEGIEDGWFVGAGALTTFSLLAGVIHYATIVNPAVETQQTGGGGDIEAAVVQGLV